MATLRGLLFDMDGLLLDTERLSKLAYEAASARFGLTAEEALFQSLIGRNSKSNEATLRDWLPGYVEYCEFEAAWTETYLAAMDDGVPVRPQVVETLQAFACALPMAVATSSKRATAERKLERAGLRGHFAALIGGDEVRESKPAPEIFERAAALLGLAPGDCAAFEDSVNGVRSAAAAGCIVVQIPDLVPPTEETQRLAHHIAPDFGAAFRTLELL